MGTYTKRTLKQKNIRSMYVGSAIESGSLVVKATNRFLSLMNIFLLDQYIQIRK